MMVLVAGRVMNYKEDAANIVYFNRKIFFSSLIAIDMGRENYYNLNYVGNLTTVIFFFTKSKWHIDNYFCTHLGNEMIFHLFYQ